MEPELDEIDRNFARFARSGDPVALGAVYDRVAPELLALALHLTQDAAEAEDVLQATFVAAIERASSFDPERRVLPWLAGILANEARSARARRQRAPDPARLPHPPSAAPDLDAERAELLEHLDRSLTHLPEAFRPVVVLRLRHGLSTSEIAAALGRPSGTVRSQLARSCELLRRALPASLAGAIAASCAPTRGLAAVREAVVSHALGAHAPLALSSTIGGFLAMKKLVLLAAALVAAVSLGAVFRASRASVDAPLAPVLSIEPPVATLPLDERPAPSERTSAAQRAPVATPEPVTPAEPRADALRAALLVRATWDDGTPAEGEIVLVRTIEAAHADDVLPARAGADGVARFDGLAPGSAQVRLLRGGENTVFLAAGETRTVELTIGTGVTAEGEVVDARGAPVASAALWLSERYRTNLGHVVAHTDERGRFRVPAVGPDHYLGARKRGFAPSGLRSLRAANGDRIEVRFVLSEPGVAVRGRVRDADGQPVAGAQVLLGTEVPAFDRRLDDGSFAPAAPPARAWSDARGEFELECAPLGELSLQARARGFAPYMGSASLLDPPAPLEIVLVQEARVRGTVRAQDGAPVQGAWIRAGEPERFAASSCFSGLDGSFELSGLAAGTARLIADHHDHGEARTELHPSAGDELVWDCVLRPAAGIHGRLLDERGAPLAGLVVVALPASDPEQRSRSEASDAQGWFSIRDVADEAHVLRVQRPLGWRDFPLLELEDVWPSSAPLELFVPDPDDAGARIQAEVVSPAGEPVGGAELQVWHKDERAWRSFVSAGETGRIEATGVPPGTCELELRHPDHPWVHLGERRVEAGGTLDLGLLRLEAAGRLRGTLAGVPDEVLAGVRGVLTDATQRRESGVVRVEQGELSSGPLAPGKHLLVLAGDFVESVRLEVEIAAGAERSLDVRLERCGMRRALFELPPGEKPRWLGCTLLDDAGRPAWVGSADCSQERPEARISAPPGIYRLEVGGEGGLVASGAFVIERADGAEAPLYFLLSRKP